MDMLQVQERTRGVVLKTLDLAAAQAQVAAHPVFAEWAAKGMQPRLQVAPYAMVEIDRPQGPKMYVVCVEGVGWEVHDGAPLEVPWGAHTETTFTMAPVVTTSFGADEVRAMATGPDVDLADLIRSFGQRLEDNFWLWHHVLTGVVE